eukprot:scaffold289157_cov20-Tisochrysis_lutea.AAC.1
MTKYYGTASFVVEVLESLAAAGRFGLAVKLMGPQGTKDGCCNASLEASVNLLFVPCHPLATGKFKPSDNPKEIKGFKTRSDQTRFSSIPGR